MYACIQLGSFQFKVAEGDKIDAPKLDSEVGQALEISDVYLYANGDDVRVGDPLVKNVTVHAKIVSHLLDEKDINFKFKKRKDSRKTIGHRQQLTALLITKIEAK
ncbi:MAG: 50S ribosomal protein L21 [Candidatus Omnitrophica bacterium]|nr:50S ribosomal protein L21 [Candidatus Omnitrophota bacterium]